MVICVAPADREQALAVLREQGEAPFVIGEIIAREQPEQGVVFSDA